MQVVNVSDSDLEATLEKELVRARLEVELFHKRRPVRLGRFEVLRCIGRGSLGVVYEARDTVYGGRVALKLLRRVDGRTIAQFKHEFRVLSGITHRNLVALHELVCERDSWFVSMELIDGVPFDQWLRGERGVPFDERRMRAAVTQLVQAVGVIHRAGKLHRDLKPSNVLITPEGRLVVLDFGLVSTAVAQKLGGPLIAPPELGSARGNPSDSSPVLQGSLRASPPVLIGTPGYMAPEQAAREPAQEASDWYAVGVMLFEVLTRRLPFEGSTRAVLRDKRVHGAPRVRELNPNVTHSLDTLCWRLLEREPSLRGGAPEIEAWLGRRSWPGFQAAPARRISRSSQPSAALIPLHGRSNELQLLAAALERAAVGGGARVWVSGAPGIGKTALLDSFASQLPLETLVLQGRCREDESIPLKPFDALADALRERFAGTEGELPELELKDRAALVAAFPVLAEVEGLGPPTATKESDTASSEDTADASEHLAALLDIVRETVPMSSGSTLELGTGGENESDSAPTLPIGRDAAHAEPETLPHEVAAADGGGADDREREPGARERNACLALSRLLHGLCAQRPVAILLDDLQWADLESARYFESVFGRPGAPGAPGLLFVGAFRRDEASESSFIDRIARVSPLMAAELVELAPLELAAATALADSLLHAQDIPATPALCRKLASDTHGSPFLLTELVQQLKRPRRSSASPRSSTGAIALASALRARVDALPASARRLLAVLCVAQAPLALRSALSVAGLPQGEQAALTVLCSTRLVRSRGGRPIETLEPYHESVRDSVLSALSPDERSALAAEIELVASCEA